MTFSNGIPPKAPYYYISAHLDLSGVHLGQNESLTYYFNGDNSLVYLDSLVSPNYHNYHMIGSNAVIGDVVLYSNPDLVLGEGADLEFDIGGAEFDPDNIQPESAAPVEAVWAGPTGFASGPVNAADINTGVVCFYGHEGGHDPLAHASDVDKYRYLAVSIHTGRGLGNLNNAEEEKKEESVPESLESSRAVQRKEDAKAQLTKNGKVLASHEVLDSLRANKSRRPRKFRQVLNPDIVSGTLFVVVKVYPKAHP
jgi:hypothetical protein